MKEPQPELDASKGKDSSDAAFHLICLGSSGGPSEDNVTGFLLRSLATGWSRGSVLAVDAGSHLAPITRILQDHFPLVYDESPSGNGDHSVGSPEDGEESGFESSRMPTPEPEHTKVDSGPFAGLSLPNRSARANALHFVREHVSAYLITHPHLDHLSGFVINTAAFHMTSRPKRLAAMPSTIFAIKTHIFNDIIWPNLTDEDGGVGFVSFQRLVQGGNMALGEGSSQGYIEVCNSLCVKGMKISHGHCPFPQAMWSYRASDVGLSDAHGQSATLSPLHHPKSPGAPPRRMSSGIPPHTPQAAPATHQRNPSQSGPLSDGVHRQAVVDSTAYFIRDDATAREVLVFGDVEPDSVSLNPRTHQVWAEASPKFAHGQLRAVVIECSYDDSQADNVLFGHLAPRHLFMELTVLAELVKERKAEEERRRHHRKRKRRGSGAHSLSRVSTGGITAAMASGLGSTPLSTSFADEDGASNSRQGIKSVRHSIDSTDNHLEAAKRAQENIGMMPINESPTLPIAATAPPLTGLKVIVMHVKDTLKDGPLVGDIILRQLKAHEAKLIATDGMGLGCEFFVSHPGASYFF